MSFHSFLFTLLDFTLLHISQVGCLMCILIEIGTFPLKEQYRYDKSRLSTVHGIDAWNRIHSKLVDTSIHFTVS